MVQQYRWCSSKGGAAVKVVQQYRWCSSEGGAAVKVVQQYRWCCSKGGAAVKVVQQYRWCCSVFPHLTLLDGGRSGTLGVVVLLLRRVVSVLRSRVRGGSPLLVAIVTVRRLGGGALRLAELQPDLPVLFLHLSNPGLEHGSLQDSGRRCVGQTGSQEEGASICGGGQWECQTGCDEDKLTPHRTFRTGSGGLEFRLILLRLTLEET